MEEKEFYTKQEVKKIIEDSILVYNTYAWKKGNYDGLICRIEIGETSKDENRLKELKNDINQLVDECIEKLPKSLINKLGIKKIK
ncbi:MAG: hypothetical protein WCT51_04505 [Candidatus Shapirobacteria bacterium]|jgi:hypothetical protein